ELDARRLRGCPDGQGAESKATRKNGECGRKVSSTHGRHTLPYTGTMPPRVTLLSGEARNTMVRATSSTLGQEAWLALGMSLRLVGVSRIEGATALTRMFLPATSSASAMVSVATAALLAA